MISTNAEWLFLMKLHASTHKQTFIFVASRLVPLAPHFQILRKTPTPRRSLTKKEVWDSGMNKVWDRATYTLVSVCGILSFSVFAILGFCDCGYLGLWAIDLVHSRVPNLFFGQTSTRSGCFSENLKTRGKR